MAISLNEYKALVSEEVNLTVINSFRQNSPVLNRITFTKIPRWDTVGWSVNKFLKAWEKGKVEPEYCIYKENKKHVRVFWNQHLENLYSKDKLTNEQASKYIVLTSLRNM